MGVRTWLIACKIDASVLLIVHASSSTRMHVRFYSHTSVVPLVQKYALLTSASVSVTLHYYTYKLCGKY